MEVREGRQQLSFLYKTAPLPRIYDAHGRFDHDRIGTSLGRVDDTARRRVWTAAHLGGACTALAGIFLTFDTVLKVLKLGPAVQGTIALGYPADSVQWIGIIELVCLVLYVVPRTWVLGGLLLTGYLGGAIATHVRISSPLLTHTLSLSMSPSCSGEDCICASNGCGPSCPCGTSRPEGHCDVV